MKLKKIVSNLAFQVLVAIVAGVLLGHFYPALGVKMEIIGKSFINIIKLFIGPIIFLTIVLGITGIDSLKKVGRVGVRALVYFEIVSTIALSIGVLVAYIVQPGSINMSGLTVKDASPYTQHAADQFSWLGFFLSNFTLQVLLAGIIAGIILSNLKNKTAIIKPLESVSHYVFLALKYVMYLAPLGAFGGMAFAVGKFGLQTLLPLGKLMLCVYMTMALFVFVILGAIMRYYKLSIWKFLNPSRKNCSLCLAHPLRSLRCHRS